MHISIDVSDEHRTVQAEFGRGGQLVQAAIQAAVQLGGLSRYITSLKLSFGKAALADILWPRFEATLVVPGTAITWTVRGTWLKTLDTFVRSPGLFPTDDFVEEMVDTLRAEVSKCIEELRANLAVLEATLPLPAEVDVT